MGAMTHDDSARTGATRPVVAFVQARMGSKRFPGKMLVPFRGRPMLEAVTERVRAARTIDGVVVTTTTDASDDPLAAFAEALGLPVFRGSGPDVLERLIGAAGRHPCRLMVRISGDSPLMRPDVIDLVVSRAGTDVDLTTNVHPRTFPRGCSVEVFPPETLARIAAMSPTDADREHVTALVYRLADRFAIRPILNPAGDESATNLCVDRPEDLARLEALAGCLP